MKINIDNILLLVLLSILISFNISSSSFISTYIIEILICIVIVAMLYRNRKTLNLKKEKLFTKYILMYLIIEIYCIIIILVKYGFAIDFITRSLGTTIYGVITIITGFFLYNKFKNKIFDVLFSIFVIIYTFYVVKYFISNGIINGIMYYFQEFQYGNELEIHILGYIFGIYLLYYLIIDKNIKRIIIAIIYGFLVGKRIVFLAIIVTLIFNYVILKNKKISKNKILIVGISLMTGLIGYITLTRNGYLNLISEKYNINFMSRLRFYDYFKNTYEISILYFGNFLGYTDKMMQQQGVMKTLKISNGTGLHNDILKYYIDLGMIMWMYFYTFFIIRIPLYIQSKTNVNKARIAMIFIIYFIINELVSNIAREPLFILIFSLIIFRLYEAEERTELNEKNMYLINAKSK